jgi:glucose/mannose-6-phosphate isomerase
MNLDNSGSIRKADPNKVGESIIMLPEQIMQVLEETRTMKLPKNYHSIKNVVVDGMGGSNLGARIIRSVFNDKLKVPLEIKAGYELPGFVTSDTFYILSSYSGTTEETLSTYSAAKKKGAKLAVLSLESQKSELKKIAEKDKLPLITFDPKFNLCGQPRLGVGYSVAGLLAYFMKANLIRITYDEFVKIIRGMTVKNKKYSPQVSIKNNTAKKLAMEIKGKIPVLVSGGILEGNMHALRNQLNESGKNFASYLVLPELNHYAMEGLTHPEAKKNLHFIFFDSSLEHPRVMRRSELTKKVVKGDNIGFSVYKPLGNTRLEQAMDVLQFGSWLSYYYGLVNGENPSEVKWVDWFKKELGKSTTK